MDEIEAIRARWAATTQGPWGWYESYEGADYYDLATGRDAQGYVVNRILDDGSAAGEYGPTIHPTDSNAVAIAAAPTDIATLLAALDQVTAERDALRATLAAIVDEGAPRDYDIGNPTCGYCSAYLDQADTEHRPDCLWLQARALVQELAPSPAE